jgi:hypothetical protein
VGSARSECLDRMLSAGERRLRLVLGEHAGHYSSQRARRALRQNPPAVAPAMPRHHRSHDGTANTGLTAGSALLVPGQLSFMQDDNDADTLAETAEREIATWHNPPGSVSSPTQTVVSRRPAYCNCVTPGLFRTDRNRVPSSARKLAKLPNQLSNYRYR